MEQSCTSLITFTGNPTDVWITIAWQLLQKWRLVIVRTEMKWRALSTPKH